MAACRKQVAYMGPRAVLVPKYIVSQKTFLGQKSHLGTRLTKHFAIYLRMGGRRALEEEQFSSFTTANISPQDLFPTTSTKLMWSQLKKFQIAELRKTKSDIKCRSMLSKSGERQAERKEAFKCLKKSVVLSQLGTLMVT